MRVLFVALSLMALAGCENRPAVAGLFGEEIGSRLEPANCEKIATGKTGVADAVADAMVRVKRPKAPFPIADSSRDGVMATYSAATNAEGRIEALYFSAYAGRRKSIPEFKAKVEEIVRNVGGKYGPPDCEYDYRQGRLNAHDQCWFIDRRVLGVTRLKGEDDECESLSVGVVTYERAALQTAASYIADMGESRKQWHAMRDRLPSEYVRMVEKHIKASGQTAECPYL